MGAVRHLGWDIGPRHNTLIEVPRELYDQFQVRPLRALRDLAAVPSFAIDPWDPDGPLRREQANPERSHPLGEASITVKGKRYYFSRNFVCKPDDTASRWVHVDLALNRDCCGFAMVHLKPVYFEFPLPLGGSERRPRVVIDLMLRIAAEPGKHIEFEQVRERIYELSYRGFNIGGVSYDGWQSVDSLQILGAKGYRVELYSVDKTTEAYECLLEYMRTEGAIDYYPFEPFFEEWQALELVDGKKVDHPPKGSKDVTDAVAGAVWMATQMIAGEGEIMFV